MDPSMLGGMAEMFKNPEMMKSMEAMMENPEMQKMLNDPNMISNMMGILGNAGINLPTEPPISTTEPTQDMDTQDIDTQDSLDSLDFQDIPDDLPELETVELSHKFSNDDRVVLHNLKKEIYNNLEATVEEYDTKTQRYVVLLEGGNKLSIKEDNLKAHDDLEIVD